MKRCASWSVRSIAMSALMLTASACSTAPPPTRTGLRISPNLLTEPPVLPAMPRQPDGTMTGGQCLAGGLDVYSVAGAIRLQLITLQAQLREEQAAKRKEAGR